MSEIPQPIEQKETGPKSAVTEAVAPKSATKMTFRQRVRKLLQYFNVADDIEPQADVEASIREGVSFRGSQLLILIFAIFVASLGLNTDSVAVIIGAMLISPLMGPIMGMGLALGVEDFTLLRRGLKNIGMAILGSVLASALFFLISPQYEGSGQLLARTSPSIYDVLIALFGGAAGIVGTACRNKGQVLPGVAIATSLMPPLCTAGYGMATWQANFFFGAFYLFFTNMIFILFATWIGLKLMGFKRHTNVMTARYRRVQWIVYSIVFLTIGVSAFLTVRMIQKNVFLSAATDFVEKEMVFPNTQVLNHNEYIKNGKRYIDVTLIGAELPKDSLQLAMVNKLDSVGLGGTVLSIKQGFAMTRRDFDDDKNADRFYSLMQTEIASRQQEIDSLRRVADGAYTFSNQGSRIAGEVKVLFPSIRDIAMSRVIASSTADTVVRDTLDVIFVNAPGGLGVAEQTKLREYVGVRLHKKNLHLVMNPSAFPWPQKSAAVRPGAAAAGQVPAKK